MDEGRFDGMVRRGQARLAWPSRRPRNPLGALQDVRSRDCEWGRCRPAVRLGFPGKAKRTGPGKRLENGKESNADAVYRGTSAC